MATLDNFTWTRFEPDLGDNLKLPPKERLHLLIACGLSKQQLKQFNQAVLGFDEVGPQTSAPRDGESETEALERATREAAAKNLAGAAGAYVRAGAGRHSIGGREVRTLEDYLLAILEQRSQFSLSELIRAMHEINSVGGNRALFSERLFGGSSFTAELPSDEAGEPPGSH